MGVQVDFLDVRAFPVAFCTGLDSDELERLPETSTVHHATPIETRASSSLGGLLLTRGARSVCGQRMTLLIPRSFDVADPHACSRCLDVMAKGRGGQEAASS